MQDFIETIKSKLSNGLPGNSAQFLMAPVHKTSHYKEIPNSYQTAAVLLLLFPKNEQWHISFIRRIDHDPKDKHAGQISFPGGRLEADDESIEYCALRETEEEVGVAPNNIQILGSLSQLYVFVSNYLVHPFVGFVNHLPEFIPNKLEVDEVLEVPVNYLLDSTIRKRMDLNVRGHVLRDVPYFDLDGKVLWGATAMMLSEFLEIIRS